MSSPNADEGTALGKYYLRNECYSNLRNEGSLPKKSPESSSANITEHTNLEMQAL